MGIKNLGSLSETQFGDGKRDFNEHYGLRSGDGVTPIANNFIECSFHDFKSVVCYLLGASEAQGIYSFTEDNLAFKFIHRYDVDTNQWFLTIQPCLMLNTAQIGQSSSLKTIVPRGTRFDIKGGQISFSTFAEDLDQNYFDHIWYLDDAPPSTPVSSANLHVQAVIIPWKREIKRLAEHNLCYDNPNAVLVIACRTYEAEPGDGDSNVKYPHSIAFCMKLGKTNILGEKNPDIGYFHNSGADIGGLCPPNCEKYHLPNEFPAR